MPLKCTERNYKFTDPIIALGHIFGVVPYYSFPKQKLCHERVFKLYGLLLAIYLITAVTVPYYLLHQVDTVISSHLVILQLLEVLTTIILFLAVTLGSSHWNMKSWEKILKLFYHREYHVELSSKYFLGTPFLFLIGGFPGLLFFGCSLFLVGGFLALPVLVFYCARHITMCLMVNIVSIVRNRYKAINDTLGDISRCIVINTSTVKRLQEVQRIYMETNKIVDIFNVVFGWPILLLGLEFMQNVLLSLAVLTERGLKLPTGINLSKEVIILNILFVVSTVSGPTVTVFSCDGAVQDAVKLLKKCYKLYDNIALLAREKEEMLRLENLLQKGPRFTAANFFEVKRSTLLSFIGIITTYMIVILQSNYL